MRGPRWPRWRPRTPPGRSRRRTTASRGRYATARLHAFIVLCLLTGVRSEEARALTWRHVDLDAGTIKVWWSVRAHGDTKTNRSRRTLKLPEIAVEALGGQKRRQAEEHARAGRRLSRIICGESSGRSAAAGLGSRWVPKELRTSFVSMMSYQGVPVEEIARLAGHASSRTTEVIHRRELRPVITTATGAALGADADG